MERKLIEQGYAPLVVAALYRLLQDSTRKFWLISQDWCQAQQPEDTVCWIFPMHSEERNSEFRAARLEATALPPDLQAHYCLLIDQKTKLPLSLYHYHGDLMDFGQWKKWKEACPVPALSAEHTLFMLGEGLSLQALKAEMPTAHYVAPIPYNEGSLVDQVYWNGASKTNGHVFGSRAISIWNSLNYHGHEKAPLDVFSSIATTTVEN